MDAIRNPFAPGAGTPPPELSGRTELLERARVALERVKLGRASKSMVMVGLRGVGKTVLLNEINLIAERIGFLTALVEAHEEKPLPVLLLPQIRRLMLELDRVGTLSTQVKLALRILKSFVLSLRVKYSDVEIGLDIDPERGVADSGDLEADLPDLFVALGRAAKARERPIALFIDELQYVSETELSALIMALHRVAQEQLPLFVMAAGLPQIVALSGKSKSYAERMFDFPALGALSEADARQALVRPVESEGAAFDDVALLMIFSATAGYPFFLQEWGYQAWNTAAGPVISAADAEIATQRAIANLDESFFRVRFDRLTPRERDYLRAVAELGPGPHRSGDIAEVLGVKVQSVGPVRSSLIGKGMIYAPAHGDTAFTVPLFDGFLRRIMPEWREARHG